MAKHALKPVRSTHSRMKLMVPVIVAGSLLSTGAAAQASPGPLQAPTTAPAAGTQAKAPAVSDLATASVDISAPAAATLSFERPAVKTTPAPPKPAPAPVAPAGQDTPATPAAPDTTVQDVAAAAVGATNPANIPGATGATATGATVSIAATAGTGATDAFGAKIVAEALAEARANIQQDCTSLVSNALLKVGIHYHNWPAGYMSLGSITTTPQPGDLIYYKDGGMGMAHIAVYIGGPAGKNAVHGGWNEHDTVVGPVNVGSGPIFIHVNR